MIYESLKNWRFLSQEPNISKTAMLSAHREDDMKISGMCWVEVALSVQYNLNLCFKSSFIHLNVLRSASEDLILCFNVVMNHGCITKHCLELTNVLIPVMDLLLY